jgi:hypothetical protein
MQPSESRLHPGPFSRIQRVLASVALAGLCAACEMSPAAPSASLDVGRSRGTQVTALDLRWDLTATGCAPMRPAPTVPAEPRGLTVISDGIVQGLWDPPGERAVFAEFHREGLVYALCFWDTTGV